MNVAEQLEAEQISKKSKAHYEAIKVLNQAIKIDKYPWLVPIIFGINGLVGSGLIIYLSNDKFIINPSHFFITCVLAWVGFALAAFSFKEVRQIKKQLNAALLILNLNTEKEIDFNKKTFE